MFKMDIKDLLDENERIRIDSPEKLELYIQVHHERFHNLLLWSYGAIFFNIIIVMIRIFDLYSDQGQMYFLKITYGIVTVVFAGFLIQQWRAPTDLGNEKASIIYTLLRYKVGVTQKEIGMIAGYLITYGFILGAGFIFYKITGLIHPNEVFKTNSTISIFMVILGLYSLIKALIRRHRLLEGLKQIQAAD